MIATLPKPLTEYFAATNTDNAASVAACFAEDAVVHDERRDYRGRDAVRAWAEETRRKYRYRVEVLRAEEAADRIVVTAHLTGNFPGSPIDLDYRFELGGGKITALTIG